MGFIFNLDKEFKGLIACQNSYNYNYLISETAR